MRHTRVLLGALIVMLALGTATWAQGPQRIGELETIRLTSGTPYESMGAQPLTFIVDYEDATYIRVHFSKFDLAPGDWVEVSDLAELQSFRYSGRGLHGTGEFWANTIVGDAAVIKLYAPNGGGAGFEIDSFGRGTVEWFSAPQAAIDPIGGVEPPDPNTDSVCGTNDWRDVECYRSSNPTEFENARAAAKAIIGCCSSCTGFKVSDSGQFLTNEHCTNSQSGVQSTEMQLEYQLSGCGSGTSGDSGRVDGQTLLATGYTLDYTLFTTTGNSSGIPCLELDDRLVPQNERIYIAGHPNGGVKKLSLVSTHSSNPSGFCEADLSPCNGRGTNSDVCYMCDTTGGSSGSPVISGVTHKVVALHHFGGCYNSGGRSDQILNAIGGLIETCTGGGGSECGDGTCDPGENACSCPQDCGTPPSSETGSCDNGLDDDCDGDTDCDDADCAGDPACETPPTCGNSGDSCGSHGDCCPGLKCKGGRGGKQCR